MQTARQHDTQNTYRSSFKVSRKPHQTELNVQLAGLAFWCVMSRQGGSDKMVKWSWKVPYTLDSGGESGARLPLSPPPHNFNQSSDDSTNICRETALCRATSLPMLMRPNANMPYRGNAIKIMHVLKLQHLNAYESDMCGIATASDR